MDLKAHGTYYKPNARTSQLLELGFVRGKQGL